MYRIVCEEIKENGDNTKYCSIIDLGYKFENLELAEKKLREELQSLPNARLSKYSRYHLLMLEYDRFSIRLSRENCTLICNYRIEEIKKD